MNRSADWMKQADRDFQHAKNALTDGDYEWACFAAQQSAEKALKSVFQSRGQEGWGHSLTGLCQALKELLAVPEAITDSAKKLDKHYIPSRYPNGFPSGAPVDYYLKEDAEKAIKDADAILRFCNDL